MRGLRAVDGLLNVVDNKVNISATPKSGLVISVGAAAPGPVVSSSAVASSFFPFLVVSTTITFLSTCVDETRCATSEARLFRVGSSAVSRDLMQLFVIWLLSVTVCVPFFGYISTRSYKNGVILDFVEPTVTDLCCGAPNRKGLITQCVPHMLDNILCGRISECAACRRDCFAESLNGVKAKKDRLER